LNVPESLPASWYVDDAIYRRERDRIFARHWWLFGPEEPLRDSSAYRAERISGWPIFLIRGSDGDLRGFHNVCRHRASPLLSEGQGRCELIRCPYHGWLYDTDGQLRAARDFGDDPEFDSADFGLYPVRVECWRGLVFVCFDPVAPGLADWLGSTPALCESYPAPLELEYHGEFSVEGAANWKAYADNTVEGYHLPFVHPRLTRSVDRKNLEIRSYDEGTLFAFHVEYTGEELRGEVGVWIYRFPGFQLVAGDRAFKAERFEATGPRSLRSRNWSWFRGLSESERRASVDWSRQIVEEDIAICEAVQSNLEVGLYRHGRLSPAQESHVASFQRLVRESLDESN
jgi:choline monooxygenase